MPIGNVNGTSGGGGAAEGGGGGRIGTVNTSGGGGASKPKGLPGFRNDGGWTGLKNFFTRAKKGQIADLTVLGAPGEALQGSLGARNLATGERDPIGKVVTGAFLRGEQYGISGSGRGNTLANLGLDLVADPTILLSGGAKAASMGKRLLVEAGGDAGMALAKKAGTKAGLDVADQAAARQIIAGKLAQDGGAESAKLSTLDKLARPSLRGLEGADLAVERTMRGLVKEGRGGLRVAGKTVLAGETIHDAGTLARKLPGVGTAYGAMRTALIPRAGVTDTLGKEVSDILANAQAKATGTVERDVADRVRPLQGETKANKVTLDERVGPVRDAMDTGAMPADPRLHGTVTETKAMLDEATKLIVDNKLLAAEHAHLTTPYDPRITTDEGFKMQAQVEALRSPPKELSSILKVGGSTEARVFMPEATTKVANAELLKLLEANGIKVPPGANYFELDPVVAAMKHYAQVKKAVAAKGVLRTLADVSPDLVRIVDSSTVKQGLTPTEFKAEQKKIKGRQYTARMRLKEIEGRLAEEGPARPRTSSTGGSPATADRMVARGPGAPAVIPGKPAVPGLQNFTLDPVKRLAYEQRKIDLTAKIKAEESNLDALRLDQHEGSKLNAANDAARQAPEGFVAIKMGEQTAHVHPELAAAINPVKRLVDSNSSVTKFVRHVDEVQNFWRAQVTVLPIGTGFFARNLQGNLILNAIDNVGIRDYAQAMRIQRGVRKARKAGVEIETVLSKGDARLFRESETHNIYNQGAQEADLDHVFPGDKVGAFKGKTSPLRGKMTARDMPILGSERGPVSAGRSMNAVIENNARLANYAANVRHSGSFADAARRTRLTLFDYSDLTPLERSVGRRVVPFYTFARKSSGLLLRELIHDPSKINRITNVLGAGEDMTGRNIDSPLGAAATVLATPFIPGAALNSVGVGGYAGALKQQMSGTTIQDRETGGFTTIDPNAKQSENRAERLGNALMPVYGKYGRLQRAKDKLLPGENQDLLRILLGLSPQDDPIVRTPGGGQVLQSTAKKKAA